MWSWLDVENEQQSPVLKLEVVPVGEPQHRHALFTFISPMSVCPTNCFFIGHAVVTNWFQTCDDVTIMHSRLETRCGIKRQYQFATVCTLG